VKAPSGEKFTCIPCDVPSISVTTDVSRRPASKDISVCRRAGSSVPSARWSTGPKLMMRTTSAAGSSRRRNGAL